MATPAPVHHGPQRLNGPYMLVLVRTIRRGSTRAHEPPGAPCRAKEVEADVVPGDDGRRTTVQLVDDDSCLADVDAGGVEAGPQPWSVASDASANSPAGSQCASAASPPSPTGLPGRVVLAPSSTWCGCLGGGSRPTGRATREAPRAETAGAAAGGARMPSFEAARSSAADGTCLHVASTSRRPRGAAARRHLGLAASADHR